LAEPVAGIIMEQAGQSLEKLQAATLPFGSYTLKEKFWESK
jgi:hypothetical protein